MKEIPLSLEVPRDLPGLQIWRILGGLFFSSSLLELYFHWEQLNNDMVIWTLLTVTFTLISRIKLVIHLYPDRIENGWKIPFRKKLYRGLSILKVDFLELQMPQKEDLSFDLIVKSKKGPFIVLKNIINKNPAKEKLEDLKSNEFKSWTSSFNPIQK